MKKTLLLITLCASSFLAVPSFAADECCQNLAATVQQKLREIDVTIALKQYEQIKTEVAKAQVQLILVETDSEAAEVDRNSQLEALQRRIAKLNAHASELRARVEKLSEDVKVAAK